MKVLLLAVIAVLALGENVFGWGLMTHVELAESLLGQGSILALAVGGLLARNKRDFILGNLLADVIIGKKWSRRRKNCHDWTAGWRLLEHAHDDRTKAFAHGFITHLAADTVAHNHFIPEQIVRTGSTVTLGHLYWELMADQLTHPANRKTLRKLLREPSLIHHQLLEDHLSPDMKWFGFNRSVFTNIHRLTYGKKFNFAVKVCRGFSLFPLRAKELDVYKGQALDRMVDIVKLGKKSLFLREDPNGSEAIDNIRQRRQTG
jgi:hypothetical protein